jgi:hypothetical protein
LCAKVGVFGLHCGPAKVDFDNLPVETALCAKSSARPEPAKELRIPANDLDAPAKEIADL